MLRSRASRASSRESRAASCASRGASSEDSERSLSTSANTVHPRGASTRSPPPPSPKSPSVREELSSLRVFASYVPAEIVLRSLANHAPPSKADREDFPAAIGFVDVSGFTALSEKLLKEYGRRSSEMLNTYISSYFDGLIDGISEFGGDVIKFAGDALQVVWRHRRPSDGIDEEAEPPSLGALVLQASRCCLSLLAKLNNFSPPGVPDVCLTLHMGVGAGCLSSYVLAPFLHMWRPLFSICGAPFSPYVAPPISPLCQKCIHFLGTSWAATSVSGSTLLLGSRSSR